MKPFPQFRCRTEYSFRSVYGKLSDVVARLAELQTPLAALVDTNGSTWGHWKWETACRIAGIIPAFGIEVAVLHNLTTTDLKPRMFALALDTPTMYRLNSLAHRQADRGVPMLTVEQARSGNGGIIWFSGQQTDLRILQALNAEITVEPSSPVQRHRAAKLSEQCKRPLLPISDNAYIRPSDSQLYQLLDRAQIKPSPQHLLDTEELFTTLPSPGERDRAYKRATLLMKKLSSVQLQRAPMITVPGDIRKATLAGVKRRHLPSPMPPEYRTRMDRELKLIAEKGFESYFLVVADMVRFAKTKMLVGPARGSAAGSLVCWLLGITEIDPIKHGLLFERFIDITRKDLPDIDLDFNDAKRHLVFEYMERKYTPQCVARIGTISELKPKSILALAGKKLGIPAYETSGVRNAMFTRFSGDSRANNALEDTLTQTLPGKDFLRKYPEFLKVAALEGHASHTGIHAAGLVVCNAPIEHFCTVTGEGIIHLDKYDAEALGLLKIDALGLRTLGVIEDTGTLSNEQLYTLPLDDATTLSIFNQRKYAGIFQWEGPAVQTVTNQVAVKEFADLAHLTALARPGPLSSGASLRFIKCANGAPLKLIHPAMKRFLGDTNGIFLYQEQVLQVCREIGDMSWEDVTLLRKAMSKSLGKEYFDQYGNKFIKGAHKIKISTDDAQSIWDEMCTFGAWAFNKSHSVSYGIVSYWCAYLKAHHPLEFAAASLRNAKDDESVLQILREIVKEGIEYTPFDKDHSELNWCVKDGRLLGGFLGIKGIGPSKASAMIESRTNGGFTTKQLAALDKAELVYADLFPAHTLWGHLYTDPALAGARPDSHIIEIADMPDSGDVLFIGLMLEKDPRDENEVVRVAKRKGRKLTGPIHFLDMKLIDDSSAQITVRIDRFDYERFGEPISNFAPEGKTWFLIRGNKIPGHRMVKVEKMKCLNDPTLFQRKSPSSTVSEPEPVPAASSYDA